MMTDGQGFVEIIVGVGGRVNSQFAQDSGQRDMISVYELGAGWAGSD